MYKLTEEEVRQINDILDACDDHPGFVSGRDVAKIAEIMLRLFSKDSKPAPKKAPAKKAPASDEGNE